MMYSALLELSRPEIPDIGAVMRRAGSENFPVAARVLSRADRQHLFAVYGFARLADELGDELAGDRLAALDWLRGELDRAYAGNSRHPLLVRLQDTIAACDLPREPFLALIEANRLDQRLQRYDTWEQLQAYCELSANPVGRLVLCIFGLDTTERTVLSDRVCSALQLIEHLQDLSEDLQRGRVYLPEQDLARFGSSHEQLAEVIAHAARNSGKSWHGEDDRHRVDSLGKTIAFEVGRARELLSNGVPLVSSIRGRPKLAVAGFVAGGRAALEEIERADYDVIGGARRASHKRRLRALAKVLAESRA